MNRSPKDDIRSMTASPALFKRLLAALAGALALAVMLAPGSFAATYLVRPTGTVMQGSGWLVTPSGSTPDAVLNKNVTQPATPATSSFLTAGTSSNGQSTSVWVARPPALRSGETLKGLTAWAYLNTTASQSMTLSLYTWSFMGWQQLASASVPAGSSAGWYSARTQGAVQSWAVNAMAVSFQPSGTGGGSNAYAAYGEVDTNDPPPASSSAATSTPTQSMATSTTPQTQTANPDASNRLRSAVSVVAQTLKVALNATSISIMLSCAPDIPGGCQGTLTLRLLKSAPGAPKAGAPRAVTSRCARGCRPLGHAHFQILAGRSKRVKVHLAHSARRLFGKNKRVSLQATTVIKDKAGHAEVSNTAVTLTRADTGGGSGHGTGSPSAPAKPGSAPAKPGQ